MIIRHIHFESLLSLLNQLKEEEHPEYVNLIAVKRQGQDQLGFVVEEPPLPKLSREDLENMI